MRLSFTLPCVQSLWGFGERYDLSDHIDTEIVNMVEEKFTHQGERTYLAMPKLISASFAIEVDTDRVCTFRARVSGGHTVLEVEGEGITREDVAIHYGKPRETLPRICGDVCAVPQWVFGPWASANRWTSDDDVDDFLRMAERNGFDFSALVLEAWSDEATFYRVKKEFSDLSALCARLEERGIHLLLWQCPVLKVEEGLEDMNLLEDIKEAKERDLLVRNADGTFYTIPEGHWFQHSYVPDFTKRETREWWMQRRQHLLDAGISGFKTDGGEFILSDDAVFSNGLTGKEMRNRYPDDYVESYLEYMGPGHITFSRAGYRRAPGLSCYWAGDQMSSFDELEPVLRAGLNAAVSGVFWWGFDIAGFAGAMPSAELYLRSYALSVFTPIMQWHSEPVGGQFKAFMKSADEINDRSPWNVASYTGCPDVLDACRRLSRLRMALLPYITGEAAYSQSAKEPLMRPLFYMFPEEEELQCVYDEYMFGRSLLIAPVLKEGQCSRSLLLPPGSWYDVQRQIILTGPIRIEREYRAGEIGTFILLPEGKDLIDIFQSI